MDGKTEFYEAFDLVFPVVVHRQLRVILWQGCVMLWRRSSIRITRSVWFHLTIIDPAPTCGRARDANDICDSQQSSGTAIESTIIHAMQPKTFIIAIEERTWKLILLLQKEKLVGIGFQCLRFGHSIINLNVML